MDAYMGMIMLFAGNFQIKGWFICDGRLLPISQYSALFSLLGTTYGGNGTSTFALPDLRSRVPVGVGQGPGLSVYNYGQNGGVENNTLITSNLPSHTHAAMLNVAATNASIATATSGSSIATPGALAGRTFTPTLGYDNATPNVPLNPASINVTFTGNNAPVNNLQPYLAMSYQICWQGIYPSRD